MLGLLWPLLGWAQETAPDLDMLLNLQLFAHQNAVVPEADQSDDAAGEDHPVRQDTFIDQLQTLDRMGLLEVKPSPARQYAPAPPLPPAPPHDEEGDDE